MRASRLQKVAAGLGSRTKGSFSSSPNSNDAFARNTMLLIVSTGELACDVNEARSLLAWDDAEDERRNEVRSLWVEKRAVMEWNLEECILTD